jgi:alkylation response protein AidB-like acyl-CoA dehydrogenase
MTITKSENLPESLNTHVRDFALACIASRSDLHQQKDFPPDLWQEMIDRQLLGIIIPTEYGGRGCNYATLAACATTMAEYGGNQGVVMTWMGHNLNAALHLEANGTTAQRQHWLPRIARGESSMTVAVSEPGAGAHPKHLKTSAVRDGDDYILNGEKSYLTNGPLADVFLVLAVTDETQGRKSFSAFLVPRDVQGIVQTPGIEIDFLHPSPHCGIRLEDCRVPTSNMVGAEGTAFEAISLTMRAVEDALSTASTVGAVRYLLNQLAKVTDRQDLPREAVMALGSLSDQADLLARMSQAIAQELDQHPDDPQRLMPLNAGFKTCLQSLQSGIDGLKEANSLELSGPGGLAYDAARRDIMKMSGIAATAYQVRALKSGQALLAKNR